MIVAFIDAYRVRFGVEAICAVLSEHGMLIAPSTYYARRNQPVSAAALDEAVLVNTMIDLYRRFGASSGSANSGTQPAGMDSTSVGTRSAG